MTKQEFLDAVGAGLDGVSDEEKKKSLDFISEAIDDRIEDGMTEEEAINDIGSVKDTVGALLSDLPLRSVIRATVKPKKKGISGFAVFLIVLGAPLWLPLLIAASAVLFAIFISILAVVLSVAVTVLGVFLAGIGCIVGLAVFLIAGKPLTGILSLGAGLAAAGIALLFVPCVILLVKLFIRFTVAIPKFIKKCLIRG